MAKVDAVSPLAPDWAHGRGERPAIPPIRGVRLGAVAAGIKYAGRTDLTLIAFDRLVATAGVFTLSACASAPVEWCRALFGPPVARDADGMTARDPFGPNETLRRSGARLQGIVVNSGNANAFTGRKGREACQITARAAADALGCDPAEIALASTGVIGEPMEAGAFSHHLAALAENAREDAWWDAAEAIMTTDTFPKAATAHYTENGRTYTINGIAKGSGMIAPDMATMLAFVVTDAPVEPSQLQFLTAALTDHTFNAVTVDSDTSTSDTVLVLATGEGAPIEDPDGEFAFALERVFHDLAMQLVRDGEGATKQVEVRVRGAVTDGSARRIARAIANSPLVKTAIAGEDANWGRVVMAVGKAGEPADRDRLAISFGSDERLLAVAREGERVPDYSEADAAAIMREREITITVDLGLAEGHATVWTCDLTHGYIAINGDYRS